MMMMTSEQSGVFRSHHLDTHSLCLSCPQEIGSLRNLKFVEVSENQLMFLPLSFSSLVSLQDLHLSDNLLSLLPETMGELRNLKLLKVERNRLTALPQSMDGWTSLVELSLSQNFLEVCTIQSPRP
jgi:Leucine-rich repeat (LRR) protein